MGTLTYVGFGSIVLAGITGVIAYRKNSESSVLNRYVPVDTIKSIPLGIPIVVHGTVKAATPLLSPVTQKPCVYYKYTIQRETPQKDANGHTTWRWENVGAPEVQSTAFSLADPTGEIQIEPHSFSTDNIFTTEKFLQPGTIDTQGASNVIKMLSSMITVSNAISGNRERVIEDAIFVDTQINAFGILGEEGTQKFLQKYQNENLLLTTKMKQQLVSDDKKFSYTLSAVTILLVLLGIYLITQQ